ncbi:DNA translocase FtsK [Novipirellula artificiosorum]|uniref:DNA translocase FtsK n=1 Tax=Novipirellula artificiosorum TaxID=2528016 RepID=A0A5C6DZW6_9BACT|nr:DNA translocase FtsK [Novipirellula artificiosorum]TWU40606.1 DNA translocase FtsK [Novipirellula artificiosorum]
MSSSAADDPGANAREANLVRDVVAIVLVAMVLIAVVSIVTRSPADPIETPIWPISALYTPNSAIYPTNSTVTNACGYWGALISSALFDALGLASALVVAAVGGIATALLGRGRINAPVLRSLGGTIVVLGAATAAGLLKTEISGMPVVGNGGYLGAMGSTLLLEHFAPAGAWILSLTILTVGLLLTTDYALLYAGRAIMRGSAKVSRSGMRRAAQAMPVTLRRRRQPFTDLEEPIKIEGDVSESDSAEPSDEPAGAEPPALGPKFRIQRPKRKSPQQQLSETAAGAAAAGLAATAEAVASGKDDPNVDLDANDDDAQDEEEAWDEEEEIEEPVIRSLEIDEETVSLRGDESHDIPKPKINTPRKVNLRDELDSAVRDSSDTSLLDYRLPGLSLLESSDGFDYGELEAEAETKAALLQKTICSFGCKVRVSNITLGPVIAQYEIELEAGLRLNKISALADDLAIALRVPSVRIVAPIPGKNTVGIEVPNEVRQVVRLRDVIEESDMSKSKAKIPVFLGKDVSGNPMVVGLEKMPHLLIAGRTGTGKSVCLNAIITSILMMCRPDEVRMLMIDPKMVELSGYGRLPHLMHPVITDMRKAEAILAWAVDKMEERYSLLAKAGVRHINSYNDLGREEVLRRLEIDEADEAQGVPDKLPFIVIVADEMADLMMTAGKEVETHIIRLAQKSRAVGIHLILATQKPTVDVITGLIKSNLPARLSFQVASKTDSRVVLDENGADKLLGNGDMLFLWPGTSTLIRGQGTYLSDDEIDAVVDHCSMGEQNFVNELMSLKVDEEGGADGSKMGEIKNRDELYESAIEVVIREGRGSLSMLQRCLGIGYGRAARLIDFMAEDGIVGDYNGSKSREVLMTMGQWQQLQGYESDGEDDSEAEDYEDADDYEEYEEEEIR